ncbi:hypothetical protein VI03_08490 [Burkholderia vietnamiensis]|uniref:hypothetical protein n=1 Tax=Burkholderia vietnamiensis TaxID=60552 RepID=UPI000620F372|nr:hypothetical protein [Burkholderia vietnamiensis]KKI39271.1 hypothetical protein VI03_08490 [Burkholderia vietnamiensis]TPQ47170.1 hypothetical protein C2U71_05600 [Burkholderia ubonensis]HDR9085982.1 hypothetical protein [Burkholderia vietnamiensis]
MKKSLATIAIAIAAAHANAGGQVGPIVNITWAKEGQTLVVGTHRFVDVSGRLIPFAMQSQQKFPYSTCTPDGISPTIEAKLLPVGRTLLLTPQRTPRGTIHLDIQAEDTEVRTVETTQRGPCTSMSPVTGGLPLTNLSVDLPEQGAITASFPDGHYALTLTVERDSK